MVHAPRPRRVTFERVPGVLCVITRVCRSSAVSKDNSNADYMRCSPPPS